MADLAMDMPAISSHLDGVMTGGVALSALPARARLILRMRTPIDAIAIAFACAIPSTPLRATEQAGRAALWLGPDEWLLLASGEDGPALASQLQAAAEAHPASIVDVSHRQIAIGVSGDGAALALSSFIPLDLSRKAFPVGMVARTLFEKAEIILWRRGDAHFEIEVARSFAPYVIELLAIIRRENAAAASP